jgi:diaminopimelate decarboxylase
MWMPEPASTSRPEKAKTNSESVLISWRHLYEMAAGLKHLELKGLQTHIGSQITEPKPFADAIDKIVPVARHLRDRFGIQFFSIGGGIGIVYQGSLESGDQVWWQQKENQAMSIEEYAEAIVPRLQPLQMRVLFEPGRFLVGNAGVSFNSSSLPQEDSKQSFRYCGCRDE